MTDTFEELVEREYQYGFTTDLDTEIAPKGLTEDVVRMISGKHDEPEWLLEWRLQALRYFLTLDEPTWSNTHHAPIDYQEISYWAAPKRTGPAPESLDDIDPEMREMFDKLGISIGEQERLSGIAVDAIVDPVTGGRRSSTATV